MIDKRNISDNSSIPQRDGVLYGGVLAAADDAVAVAAAGRHLGLAQLPAQRRETAQHSLRAPGRAHTHTHLYCAPVSNSHFTWKIHNLIGETVSLGHF